MGFMSAYQSTLCHTGPPRSQLPASTAAAAVAQLPATLASHGSVGGNSGGGGSTTARIVSPFALAPPAASRTASADTSADSFAHAPPKLPRSFHATPVGTSATSAASTPPQQSSAARDFHASDMTAGANRTSDASGDSSGQPSAMAALKQRQRQQLQTRLSATGVADQTSSQRAFAATTGGRPGWDSNERDSHARLRASPAAKASLRPTVAAAHLQRGLAASSSRSAASAGTAGGPRGSDASGTAVNTPGDQGWTAASSVFRHGRLASRTAPDEMARPVSKLDHMQRHARASSVWTPCCWVATNVVISMLGMLLS